MIEASTLQHVNVVLSVVVLAGIFYLLDVELKGESFRWYSLCLGVSVVLIVGEAGIREFLAGPTHVVHAVAIILLVAGLYDPFENRVRTEEWLDLMLQSVDATETQLTPTDRRVLEVLASAGIVLTPELISSNVDGIEDEVSARLERLADQHLVYPTNQRKVHITPLGERLIRRESKTTP